MRLAAEDAGFTAPIEPGSDNDIIATAVSNIGLLLFQNVNSAEAAHDVLNATGEDLEQIRIAEGLAEVAASGSHGKITITVSGSTTIANGTALTLPNGLAATVVGTYVNPQDQDEIDVESVDVGSNTNFPAGAVVRFDVAPTNVSEDAVVSESQPLTGGTDSETDSRKRDRILNARRNRPGGGNWGQVRQWGLDASGGTQDIYVNPALGGPGSMKATPIRKFDVKNNDYSRVMSDAETQIVRSYIQGKMPEPMEVVITAVADESVDVAIEVTLPDSAQSGGNGQGWVDVAPWPPSNTTTAVTITVVQPENNDVTTDAGTSTSPVAGQTHIAWWSSADRKFYTRLVTSVSGSAGAWRVLLDAPLLDSTGAGPQVGDYVSPAALNLTKYGDQWVSLLGEFGPGENTTDTGRLPRAKRHPYVTDEDPTSITNTTLAQWSRPFPEIAAFALHYANKTSPTVPANVATAPNVLVPRRFAIYQI